MRIITKTLTNNEVYSLTVNLLDNFNEYKEYIPAAIAYGIQKNKMTLQTIANEVETARINIIKQYGEIQEDGNFKIEENKIASVNKELMDLLNIEQEIKIYTCSIDDLNTLHFTFDQIESLMFMIDEDKA